MKASATQTVPPPAVKAGIFVDQGVQTEEEAALSPTDPPSEAPTLSQRPTSPAGSPTSSSAPTAVGNLTEETMEMVEIKQELHAAEMDSLEMKRELKEEERLWEVKAELKEEEEESSAPAVSSKAVPAGPGKAESL